MDPEALHAAGALDTAGWHPTVVTGDGAEGYGSHAPYDRVIATCAVRHVPYAWVDDYVHNEDRADRTTATLDPRKVFGDEHAEFAVGVQVPGCQHAAFFADDGSGEFTLWLIDGASWASVDYEPDSTECPVDQYGPRRLWDEVEAA